MATDLSSYVVDLDTQQSNGQYGDTPFAAFTKYNNLVATLSTWSDGTFIGTSAPTSPYAYQQWIDTSSDPVLIKRRNGDNSAWVTIGDYDQVIATAAGYSVSTDPTAGTVPLSDSNGSLSSDWFDWGSIHTETPDVKVSFNESGIMEKGYGTEYVTDLPVYGVDFSRSGEVIYKNISGEMVTASADEIAIGEDGIFLHKNYTNYVTNSNTIYSYTPAASTVTLDETEFPFGTGSTVFKEDSTEAEHYVTINTFIPTSTYLNGSIYVKAGLSKGSRNFSLRFFGGTVKNTIFDVDTDGVITTDDDYATIEDIGDGWYRCSFYYPVTDTETNTGFRFHSIEDSANTFVGNGFTTFYITGAQVTNTYKVQPLVVTSGTTEDSGATGCEIPINGNIPTPSKDLTFTFDCDIPDERSVVFSANNSTNFVVWRYTPSDSVKVRMTDGETSLLPDSFPYDKTLGFQRYTIVIDNTNSLVYCYVNGELVSSTDTSSLNMEDLPLYDNDANIALGGPVQSLSLNSQLKNFNIYHYAASAEEVLSWGAPK